MLRYLPSGTPQPHWQSLAAAQRRPSSCVLGHVGSHRPPRPHHVSPTLATYIAPVSCPESPERVGLGWPSLFWMYSSHLFFFAVPHSAHRRQPFILRATLLPAARKRAIRDRQVHAYTVCTALPSRRQTVVNLWGRKKKTSDSYNLSLPPAHLLQTPPPATACATQ